MTPANVPLTLRRNVNYGESFEATDDYGLPIDFTGFTGELEVRLYGKQPGDALLTIGTVATPIEGLLFTATAIEVRIDSASIDGLPGGPDDGQEPGDPSSFVYDLLLTPPGGSADVWFEGSVTVLPGVTRL